VRCPQRNNASVFLNCPFDDAFRPLLHSALEDVGSGKTRLDKIVRIIGESRFSIQDISRIEVDAANPLPRFNMPFECGLSLGAARFGHPARARGRDRLILASEAFQDQRTLGDLAGQDARYQQPGPPI
jgi:hypothetical protein